MENSQTQKIYLSGINPTSSVGLHLGNFMGMVKPSVELQEKGRCFYFIADYHALNTVFDPAQFSANVEKTFLDFLALGIDPAKTVFYVESDIPQITELAEIISNVVTYGQMKRMHAFKDKLAEGTDTESINMGLFNYPILMAADILLFNPDFIPVGEDQVQHVEVARDIAKAFNNRYGKYYSMRVPDLFIRKETGRVLGTDGKRKMSKSIGNDISLFADEAKIKKQIMGIITDESRIHATDPGDPAKNVAFSYLRLLDFDTVKLAEYEQRYREGKVGDKEIKESLYEHFMQYFAPYRNRRRELESNRDSLLEIREHGRKQASLIATENISQIRTALGIGKF